MKNNQNLICFMFECIDRKQYLAIYDILNQKKEIHLIVEIQRDLPFIANENITGWNLSACLTLTWIDETLLLILSVIVEKNQTVYKLITLFDFIKKKIVFSKLISQENIVISKK